MRFKKDRREYPVGLMIVAFLFIFTSVIHMSTLYVKREWYWTVFKELPGWLIGVRYAFSWFQRCVGLSAAIGLLLMKEVWRKITIVWGVFTIATVFLKHPYAGFSFHCQILDKKYGYFLHWRWKP